MAFLAIIILCGLIPFAFIGIQAAQVESYTQLAPFVSTGGGVTTANVVLADLPDPNRASSITSIKSTLATDIPVVSSYVAETKTLTVGGLTESSSRSMTIKYNIQSSVTENTPQINFLWVVVPVLLGIGILALIVAAVMGAFRSRHAT